MYEAGVARVGALASFSVLYAWGEAPGGVCGCCRWGRGGRL
ncbi:hypothetical protein HMPREF1980_01809 [Actinomyces sp. oral taxon 172 str. F0311]|nr:hypothetical protein HMPREF1980_01809 [Actinomyces sp. oral taxon 172 str. F0311]